MERLEERTVLSAVVTVAPNVLGSGAGLADLVFDNLSEDGNEGILLRARQLLDLVDSGVIYQAFPGEVNEVELSGDLANLFLLLNESGDVSLIRASFDPAFPLLVPFAPTVVPPFTKDIIDVAGLDDDTIRAGGGQGIVETYLDPLDIFESGMFDRDPAKIELFGDQVTTFRHDTDEEDSFGLDMARRRRPASPGSGRP